MFEGLPRNHFGAIYADPPWHFETWSKDHGLRKNNTNKTSRNASTHYDVVDEENISSLPVSALACDDAVLFMWVTWPMLEAGLSVISALGFKYKTCAFSWTKAHARQIEMFQEDTLSQMGMGYWTRSNNEACLLATRGKPKRLNADVRQAIIEPRRQHSRKPDCVYGNIERLVAGPYLELFARTTRPGWSSWGNQVGKFGEVA